MSNSRWVLAGLVISVRGAANTPNSTGCELNLLHTGSELISHVISLVRAHGKLAHTHTHTHTHAHTHTRTHTHTHTHTPHHTHTTRATHTHTHTHTHSHTHSHSHTHTLSLQSTWRH